MYRRDAYCQLLDGHLLVLSAQYLSTILLVRHLNFPLGTVLSYISNGVGEQMCTALHTFNFKTITMTKKQRCQNPFWTDKEIVAYNTQVTY